MMHGNPEEPTGAKAGAPILFCPFCRESFEGEAVCPEHDLELVPIDRLPRSRGTVEEASFFNDIVLATSQ